MFTLLQVNTTKNITFANYTFPLTPASLKVTVEVVNWDFGSLVNQLNVVFALEAIQQVPALPPSLSVVL